MKRGKLWAFVSFGIVALFTCLFVFGTARRRSVVEDIPWLANRKPSLDNSAPSIALGKSWVLYRFRDFEVSESYSKAKQRLVAELGSRLTPPRQVANGGSYATFYGVLDHGERMDVTITILGRPGWTTLVTVRERIEPNLFERVGEWWDRLVGRAGPEKR